MRRWLRPGMMGVILAALASGCASGPATPASGGSQGGGTTASPAAAPSPTPPASQPAITISRGHCTYFSAARAQQLLGAGAKGSAERQILPKAGATLDNCVYARISGFTGEIAGYGIFRFASAAAAAAAVPKGEHEIYSLQAGNHVHAFPVPGAPNIRTALFQASVSQLVVSVAVTGYATGPYVIYTVAVTPRGTARAERLAITLYHSVSTGL